MNGSPPKRRWSQFSLKTLLVFTTVIALIFAYITYEQRLAQNQKLAVEELEKIKGVKFTLFLEGTQRPPWIQFILGDDRFDRFHVLGFKNNELRNEHELSHEKLAAAVAKLRNFRHLK